MAFLKTNEYIIYDALHILRRTRCGFKKATAKIDYWAQMDCWGLFVKGNIETIIYLPSPLAMIDLLEVLVPKWSDPIC